MARNETSPSSTPGIRRETLSNRHHGYAAMIAYTDGVALVGVLIVYAVILIAIPLGCGFGARSIMLGKGRSGASGFCLGFFLGLLGLLIAALLSEAPHHSAMKMQQNMMMMGVAQPMYVAPMMIAPQQAAWQWAADPYGRYELRYFDGRVWTANVSDRGYVSTDGPQTLAAQQSSAPAAQQTPVVQQSPTPNWALPALQSSDATVVRATSRQVSSATCYFDSGASVPLSGTLVIGRSPVAPAHLRNAIPYPLTDRESGISRTHLAVGVADDGIWVEDLASANGSATIERGMRSPLVPYQRRRVSSGTRIEFGDRSVEVR